MAIRLDASADHIVRTANLPTYTGAYTWMAWVYLVSDQNDYGIIFSISRNSGSDHYDIVGLSSDGTSLFSEAADNYGNATTVDSGSDLVVGAWAHLAIVRASATSLQMYLNGAAVGAVNNRNMSACSAPTRMEMGGGWTTDDYYLADIRVAGIKIWDVALSAADVAQEMFTITPRYTASLNIWSPCFPGASERLLDYSGNGRNWTAAGTLTDEDPPSVSWGAHDYLFEPISAAAPVTITLDTATATAGGIKLTVAKGAVTKTLDTASLTASGQIMDIQPGAISKLLDTAALMASGQVVDVQPGAISKTLNTAALTAAGQVIDVANVNIVLLAAADLNAAGQIIDVIPGGVALSLDTAALAASGQAVDIIPGAIIKLLATAALITAGQTADVQPGAVSTALDTALLAASGQTITISAPAGPVSISLDTAALLVGGPAIDIIPGGATIHLDTASLTALGIVLAVLVELFAFGNDAHVSFRDKRADVLWRDKRVMRRSF